MKRIIAGLLALSLLLLAGCGRQPEPPEPTDQSTTAPASSAKAAPESDENLPVVTASRPESQEDLPGTQAPTEPEASETEPTATDAPVTAPTEDPAEQEGLWALAETALRKEGSYTDGVGNHCDYSYEYPRINADTQGAREINQAIDERFGALVREMEDCMEANSSLICPGIGWYAQVWGDILSLVVVEDNDWGLTGYGVYCYDAANGSRLSTPQLLERLGISQEDFLAECKEKMLARFRENCGQLLPSGPQDSALQDYLDRQGSDTYVNLDLPCYPDKFGKLVIIAPILSLAGADSYDEPVYLELGAGESKP